MAVKKTQMYRRNLDGTETNLNPLTESQYVLMENGQTVQEVLSDRDSDKYTPVITNSSSTFKVGQGDNVDLSSSMKEGAYDSCVLKGNTKVNLIQESSSQDVVLPYEFTEGQYVTINDTKESGALGVELKGQTLVNLLTQSSSTNMYTTRTQIDRGYRYTQQYNASMTATRFQWDVTNNGHNRLKPNTKYYVQFTVKVNKGRGVRVSFEDGSEYATTLAENSTTTIKCSVRCGESLKRFFVYVYPPTDESYTGDTFDILDFMTIEYQEGMENWDIPYFEGMASCKMPILKTVGENLFDNSTTQKYYTTSDGVWTSANNNRSTDFIRVKGDCKYHAKCFVSGAGNPAYAWFDANKNFIKRDNHQGGVVTSPSNAHYVKAHVGNIDTELTNENFLMTVSQTDTQITEHKNYKSSILQLPEEVVLRSLPNGVCDTFNTRTGVYTQRIWSATFNGTESYSGWVSSAVAEGMTGIYTRTKVNDKIVTPENQDGQILCDTLPTIHRNQLASCQYDSVIKGNNYIGFTMKGKTSDEIKQWLSENPTTVYCELKTPIVTKINLPSTLKSWNTTTHIYSEIPENTLYPTLSHSNPSYPVILKPSTKYSIVANSYSNNHTNSAIKFNLGGATASTTVGSRVTAITTPSTLSNELLTMSGRGNKLNNVMVIEGDVVGDEPYFEGICDCKSPILSNIGETILETPFEKEFGTDAQKEFFRIVDCAEIFDNFGVGKQYTLSLDIKANKSGAARIYLQNGSGSRHNFSFDIPVTTEYVRHTKQITPTMAGDGHNFKESWLACFTTYNTGCFATIKNIRISTGEDEPYKSNILSCETYFDETTQSDKTIVLRSLPSGVCDTLNVETREYVQRIGEVTLDGTKRFGRNMPESEYNKPCVRVSCGSLLVNGSNAPHFNMKADKIAIGDYSYNMNYPVMAGLYEQALYIYIPRTIIGLTTNDNDAESIANAFNSWLTRNPITVQYPLATPIVSTIDVQGFPYAYTNGHVQLSSGHNGQSLAPKVEYSLSANKTGQIDSNTRQVVRQQNKLDDLEALMLTAMIQSLYDKALLKFEYEMTLGMI